MTSPNYSHLHSENEERKETKSFKRVIVAPSANLTKTRAIDHALLTFRLAKELGIRSPDRQNISSLPYSPESDNLVFTAPITSLVAGRKIRFFRGWKQFESCIKGSNGLGLLAVQVAREEKRLKKLTADSLHALKLQYLRTRRDNGRAVFTESELSLIDRIQVCNLSIFHLAIWEAFARKTIVCSTSSNMGISLHEALRYMQQKTLIICGKRINLLNQDEGKLVIWCPDENADFMNHEKTEKLRKIERELPKLTKLRTYINRKQRDPGALRDALECGGYFFPTNPQSADELQNLVTLSLEDMSRELGTSVSKLLENENVIFTLKSLVAIVRNGQIIIESPVDGGLLGLSLNYLLLLEEAILRNETEALSVWNQASIGAALAALVIADKELRSYNELSSSTKKELEGLFPNLCNLLESRTLGSDFLTCIHGVFDSSNLQSLAQLFGVVCDKHLTGRGTAFVGLGSSSYANGNLCYDILKESAQTKGAFQGRASLHPATHSLNPIAQALVFSDDLYRVISSPSFQQLDETEQMVLVQTHVRKPEPAGAAALAGYLLSRLDSGTLTYYEIAYALKLGGFSKNSFLRFCGYMTDDPYYSSFIQSAFEEGDYMGLLAENILIALDLPTAVLGEKARRERLLSRIQYSWASLDGMKFESLNPSIYMCLTGDNCAQPEDELIKVLLENSLLLHEQTKRIVDFDQQEQIRSHSQLLSKTVNKIQIFLTASIDRLEGIQTRLINSILKPIATHFAYKVLSPHSNAYLPNSVQVHSQNPGENLLTQLPDKIRELVPTSEKPVLIYGSVFPFYSFTRQTDGPIGALVLNAILNGLGEKRTLIMHTDTAGYTDGILNLDEAPAQNGMLNELFRNYPGALRTRSAFFSFAAIGKDRDTIADLSPLNPWGKGSVFEWLEKNDAYILMLGVPWKMCDFLHRAEWLAQVPYRYSKNFEGEIISRGRKLALHEQLFVRCLNPRVEVDWGQLDRVLEPAGMKRIQFGRIQLSVMKAQALIGCLLNVLKTDPYSFVKDTKTIKDYFASLSNNLNVLESNA